MPTQINEFSKTQFCAHTNTNYEIAHDVYRRGVGPAVVIIQELPGIEQSTLRLADNFVDAGFEVVMPHLFGPIGQTRVLGNLARAFCLRKEFSLFSRNKASPVVDWLKALCQSIRDEKSIPGVGVIGMCLTGNFAISLMADSSVLGAVASQPAMPLNDSSALHMSESDIAEIKQNIDRNEPIKAYRFAGDWMSKQAKFDTLERVFNDDRERIQMNVLPGDAHSVLTRDFVDKKGHPTHQALTEVLSYFERVLSIDKL